MNWEDQEQDIGKSRHAFKEMLTDRSIYDNTQHYFPYIVKREDHFDMQTPPRTGGNCQVFSVQTLMDLLMKNQWQKVQKKRRNSPNDLSMSASSGHRSFSTGEFRLKGSPNVSWT
ncbi:hypothetical protein RUM44_004798 [Polyplax serrata]|uniref:Uncharacterized protein n=1 Tax=Polyplax serrata TaxID=468196 RepID=A0ABR1B3X6_POLSC